MEIKEILDLESKSEICDAILRALPDWFGVEKSIVDYVKDVQNMPFFVAYENTTPIGFVAIKIHNLFTAEVCVMGVTSKYHRHGIGTRLIECVENFCKINKFKYLAVKTLDGSVEFQPYEKTRKFYDSMGFVSLEVFPLFWDEANPCLFLAKHIECCCTQ